MIDFEQILHDAKEEECNSHWTETDEYEHWNGSGHIEFFVHQNVPGTFEIDITDYSGCAGGLQETLGIEYCIEDIWCLHQAMKLREGVTYTLHDLEVTWTRGDGWCTDDDVEYDFGDITSHATAIGYLSHKIKMIWWRKVQCHIRDYKEQKKRLQKSNT